MEKDEAWRLIHQERAVLADVLDTLSPTEWETPSVCEGWSVRDVAAHLIGAPQYSVGRALVAGLRARGDLNRAIHDEAKRWAQRPTGEIVADYRRLNGVNRPAPFTTWHKALLDTLVHTQDIVIPLGRTQAMPRDAAREAADRAWVLGWPWFPKRRFRSVRLEATDVNWARGRGPVVRGPMWALLLLVTGRTVALPHLTGEGLVVLAGSAQRPVRPGAGPR